MSSTVPTTDCKIVWTGQPDPGVGGVDTNDIVHVIGPNGTITSWLDYTGTPGGNWAIPGPAGSSGASGTSLVQTGLLAQYALLDGSGTTISDSSGNGNNGTLASGTNAPTWITTGLSFNSASQQYVSLPAVLNSAKSIMVCAGNPVPSPGIIAPFVMSNNGGVGTSGSIMFAATTVPGASPNQTAAMHLASFVTSSSTAGAESRALLSGPVCLAWVMNSLDDIYVNGVEDSTISKFRGLSGMVTTGNYQLGGSATGGASPYFYTGQIYYVVFYSIALTPLQIAQNTAFLNAAMQARGLNLNPGESAGNNDIAIFDGDSITAGAGLTTPWVGQLTLAAPTVYVCNNGQASINSTQTLQSAYSCVDPTFNSFANRNTCTLWIGTNDGGSSSQPITANIAQYCRARRSLGFKVNVATMISRNGEDTLKNTLNAALRQTWSEYADGLIDVAANPNLGADGAYASSTYFQQTAGVHPTQQAATNIIVPLMQRAVNRLWSSQDFSSANVYTSGAPSPTAITAASQSGNTMTFTSTLNPPVGSLVVVAGMTPSGYNSSNSGSGGWLVLTSSSSSFTAYNGTTGLGVGTGFGTASVPQQLDEDKYVVLGGSSSGQNFTLQTAIGLTGQKIYIKNTNSNSWTVTPFGSETIDGHSSVSLASGATLVLQSQLVSASAAGANWISSV